MTKSNRVLVLLHCSLELAILICDKAKQMGMNEKGYDWIVSKEIASLLHSLDSSVFDNIQVFEAIVNHPPYHLPYVLVPFYGSYDDMVEQIFYKSLDAAVGDTETRVDRYQYAEFSQPYVESGLVMIVLVKPDNSKETLLFMKTFTTKM
ncbi:hypothetical protein QYF36_008424 [Acer negundo]|nr:hypothetical protein QYF36_008424 [Acer negundo]